MNLAETCSTCKWCSQEGPDYFMCLNEDSDSFGFEIDITEKCDGYKSRYGKEKQK